MPFDVGPADVLDDVRQIIGYPVDGRGDEDDLTMAYVGTRKLFEDAGFTCAAETTSVVAGFTRVVMRLDLRGSGESSRPST